MDTTTDTEILHQWLRESRHRYSGQVTTGYIAAGKAIDALTRIVLALHDARGTDTTGTP